MELSLVFHPGNTTVQSYFLRLGETICSLLDDVGYDFCKGNIMAKNPKWCQPLSVWKDYFLSWISMAEPEDLLICAIFFDFRCGYGKAELVSDYRLRMRHDSPPDAGMFKTNTAFNIIHSFVNFGHRSVWLYPAMKYHDQAFCRLARTDFV